jgi:hypothetical protein
VLEGRTVRGRRAGCGGRRDIAQREIVDDHKRDRLCPVQEAPQRTRVAPQRLRDALATGQAVTRCVMVLPRPVNLDGRAFEVPGTDLVKAGFDQRRYLPAVQGDVDSLPGAEQACADREIDVEAGELRAEGARLGSPARGQRDRLVRIAVEHVGGVGH